MDAGQIEQLLNKVKRGEVGVEDAVAQLRRLPFEELGFAKIDHHRNIRCGFAEVIYCPGKTVGQIVEIFNQLAETGQNVLATRADKDVFEALKQAGQWPDVRYEQAARAIVLEQKKLEPSGDDYIAITTAGTADLAVAAEAKITAELMGNNVKLIADVGVAGIHRLLGHLEILQKANVVIVVAGMEGALASVAGGLVDCPVIAVPTSVGYGASFEGLSALLTMLNSCASGVVVVNIDNGFGAGFTAGLINKKICEKKS